MDRSFWLEKARRYIEEHSSFSSVSEIETIEDNDVITANARVGLPSLFIDDGITCLGVKEQEVIKFIFPQKFPLQAPYIMLREDFPRCFPHINPSEKDVNPCIYEGSLSELLQQAEWMNGILNQLIDWLQKAASNTLLNYEQGWEPMRNDRFAGFLHYTFALNNSICSKQDKIEIVYFESQDYISAIARPIRDNDQSLKYGRLVAVETREIIDKYISKQITTATELYEYAKSIGISNLKEIVEEVDLKNLNEDKLFVVIVVERPVMLIGSDSDSNFEFLNFVIHKGQKRKKHKRILPNCKVSMLMHIASSTPHLLKRLSGTRWQAIEKSIALVGCGSLGSKIGLHLARNGDGDFICVDNDFFLPHNNARNALYSNVQEPKSRLLARSIASINTVFPLHYEDSIFNVDLKDAGFIIDTTASLAVRNFLMSKPDYPPVISGALYRKGQYGLLLIESLFKRVNITHIWAYIYHCTLSNLTLRNAIFIDHMQNVHIGQSCSSRTMIVDDATISGISALMSKKIQKALENNLSDEGEILILESKDDFSISSTTISVSEARELKPRKKDDWRIIVFEDVIIKMEDQMKEKMPLETGGVLIGTVFEYTNTVVITDTLDAPADSIEEMGRFLLGTEGLNDLLRDIEKKTNRKVTYLGTWHSHPTGGTASTTDHNTYKKLLTARNYEPTFCLIVSPNEIFLV